MKLKHIYKLLVRTEANRCDEVLMLGANKMLNELPDAIRHYLARCGYTVNEQQTIYNVKWKYTRLKMKPNKKWNSVDCEQTNFISVPGRVVLMEAKLFGIIPMYAIDSFTLGVGRMLVKLLDIFTVTNVTGDEVDQAELVTILAEAVLIPQYFLQPYITLTEIDALTIKAIIKYRGIKAEGIFYFNKFNEFLRFETTDRYYKTDSGFVIYKWTAYAWNYVERKGKIFPSNFMAVWSLPQGDHTYFKGRVASIN